MAALNTDPLYSVTPKVSFALPILLGSQSDGVGVLNTGTITMYICFASATNGSFLRETRVKVGSVSGTAGPSAATSMRFYLSTVGTGNPTTTANTHPIGEIQIPAITDSLSVATPDFLIQWNFAIPSSMWLHCNIGVVPGGTSIYQVSTFGGDF